MYDVVIVGGGTAGMTAAIYCARGGLSTCLLEKAACGGQITQAAVVENYPGFSSIRGDSLAQNMERQALASGAKIFYENVLKIAQPGVAATRSGTYQGRALILANGVTRRKLGVPGEQELTGRGVTYCGHCDGPLFRGKAVAVVGGGNTAVEEAKYLLKICREVHLIHRREQLSVPANLRGFDNIRLHLRDEVTAIHGTNRVEAITLSSGGELAVNGVLVAIGYQPDNGLLLDLGVLDNDGYVVTDAACATSIPWLYAAGDTRQKSLRQLVTAAADGAIAAEGAIRYLS